MPRLKLQLVKEVKRTFHWTFLHVSISSSQYLRKGEDWWRVILYHIWLRSKLIIGDKNSKGEQFDEKYTVWTVSIES